MTKQAYPDWFLWAYQKGFLFWISIAGVLGVALLTVVIHLDDSVHDTELRIQQELHRVGDELQVGENAQTTELQEIREELEEIRQELEKLRGANRAGTLDETDESSTSIPAHEQ